MRFIFILIKIASRTATTRDMVRLLVANEDNKNDVGITGTPNGDGNEITMT